MLQRGWLVCWNYFKFARQSPHTVPIIAKISVYTFEYISQFIKDCLKYNSNSILLSNTIQTNRKAHLHIGTYNILYMQQTNQIHDLVSCMTLRQGSFQWLLLLVITPLPCSRCSVLFVAREFLVSSCRASRG